MGLGGRVNLDRPLVGLDRPVQLASHLEPTALLPQLGRLPDRVRVRGSRHDAQMAGHAVARPERRGAAGLGPASGLHDRASRVEPAARRHGRADSAGHRAGREAATLPWGPGAAPRPAAPACRGGAGARRAPRSAPPRRSRPRYITATRSAICRTTARSCEMNRYATRKSRLQLAQEREHAQLDGHVEAGGDLVGDHQVRTEGERPGDGDPLALPARELVRVSPRRLPRAAPPGPAVPRPCGPDRPEPRGPRGAGRRSRRRAAAG